MPIRSQLAWYHDEEVEIAKEASTDGEMDERLYQRDVRGICYREKRRDSSKEESERMQDRGRKYKRQLSL